jgi:DNA polymerase-1
MSKVTKLHTIEAVEALIEHHNSHSKYVVLDLETSGLSPHSDRILLIGLTGYTDDSAVLFDGSFSSPLIRLKKPIVAHNFKFDFHFLYRVGVDLRRAGLHGDSMLLDHLLDENAEHGLDAIIQRRYGAKYKDEFWSKYKTYEEAPEEEQLAYAGADILYTRRAYEDICTDLREARIPESLLSHVHRLALTLYNTEIQGVKIDLPYIEKLGETLKTNIAKVYDEMRALVDTECTLIETEAFETLLDSYKTDRGRQNAKFKEFNFSSTKQLDTLIYDVLELPEQKNLKGKRTCDDDALRKLEYQHPFIPKLRQYRGDQKVYTSFIEGSLEKMRGGRIYPTFNVNGTVTGRISSSNPNMQQLPNSGGVRGIYIPEDGYVFISADFQQLEVSLAAHFSRDKNLLAVVNEGASLHDITAKGLGIDRSLAKTINFALQYGAGVQKVQAVLKVSEKEAQHALDKYWETYSGLKGFISKCHKEVEEGRPLVNPFGRKRRFKTIDQLKEEHGNKGFTDRKTGNYVYWWKVAMQRQQRQAPNALIQGCGSDCTSRALYQTYEQLGALGMVRLAFSVHDEILLEVLNNEEACTTASHVLKSNMEQVGVDIGLTVNLKAELTAPAERWND